MKTIDTLSVFILIFLVFMYRPKITKSVDAILDKNQSLFFEILETIVILGVTLKLYEQKQYILSIVFLLQFIEHIRQITYCYRQNTPQLQILTIVLQSFFLFYAYKTKCLWVIPLFVIGICIHIFSIYNKKSFSDIVCLSP
jgi:hypothetical protein